MRSQKSVDKQNHRPKGWISLKSNLNYCKILICTARTEACKQFENNDSL